MTNIQMHHIAKSFGELDLFIDLSLQIADGEKVGLVGVNGCGKTTLLRILAGLEYPDSGEIHLARQAAIGLLKQSGPADADDTLSGGERSRLALTRLLADQPDLMLLDEPTSNLDLQGINQTIKLLRDSPASMLIVSHDRYFLDCLVDRIFELENGKISEYQGNYTDYRLEKARLYEEQLHRYTADRKQQQNVQAAIRQTREWAEKAHRTSTLPDPSGNKAGAKEYRRVKARKMDRKAKNDRKRLERMISEGESKPTAEKKVFFSIEGLANSGRRLLEATNLSKTYGQVTLFDASNFSVQRGEKVAVFGPNGCGKTTLIRMIQGLETADSGQLWLSPSSRPHVLPQIMDLFAPGQTLMDYLVDRLGHLDGQNRATLAQMGFTVRHLQQDISSLSLGEQMKIKLAEPILARKDFLILDEPTNYLDLHARERLEEALADYQGTLLLVSHDFYLLRKICNKVLLFENRQIRRLEKSFDEYLADSFSGSN